MPQIKWGPLIRRKDRIDVGSLATLLDIDQNLKTSLFLFIKINEVLKRYIWAFLSAGRDMT